MDKRKVSTKKIRRKRFKKRLEGGTISIEIDELTPCLKRIKDGKTMKTYFVHGLPSDEELCDWEFDWKVELEKGFEIKQLYVEGDDRIQGMIAYRPRADYLAIEVDIVEAAPFNNPHHSKFVSKNI